VAEELIVALYGSVATDAQFGLENAANDYDALYVHEGARAVAGFFGSLVRYLGPLRADPQAVQRFAPSSEPDDVGTKGEFAAAVYDANRQQSIAWWHPKELKVIEGPLADAVNAWLRHLGVAHGVSTRESAVPGVSWQVQHLPGSATRPLAAVGVGVSQVLPIVVAGLLAPRGVILLIEQPELHLHPRAQARLGDFFLGLANVGKQCVIETHSDALVNQLRLAMVKGGPPTREQIEIYFVTQKPTGDSQFAPVDITESGRIRNWPTGFFDETAQQEDAITRAALLKRSAKQSRDD
jgi:predicted ATPase